MGATYSTDTGSSALLMMTREYSRSGRNRWGDNLGIRATRLVDLAVGRLHHIQARPHVMSYLGLLVGRHLWLRLREMRNKALSKDVNSSPLPSIFFERPRNERGEPRRATVRDLEQIA